MLIFHSLHPRAAALLGYIPQFLDPDNPAKAKEQFNHTYAHGGGWFPMKGFTMDKNQNLHYPGDPPMAPVAKGQLRDETILVYPYAWVAIIQADGSFEVARMD